eukprot:4835399-Prymnesium_polylepis.3
MEGLKAAWRESSKSLNRVSEMGALKVVWRESSKSLLDLAGTVQRTADDAIAAVHDLRSTASLPFGQQQMEIFLEEEEAKLKKVEAMKRDGRLPSLPISRGV